MFGKIKKPRKKVAARIETNTPLNKNFVPITIKTHKDNKGGHPHGIIDDIDDKHVSVGFTHSKKKGKNGMNYTLEYNPLGGKDTAYMRRQATVDKQENYYAPKKGKMSKRDFKRAKQYADKAKQKYIDKKKGKKK